MPSLWDRYVVPGLIACACAGPSIMKQRPKVVPKASGRVLELGVGGGLNLAFYDPTKVSEVVGIDPSIGLRQRAERAPRPDGLKVTVVDGSAEALPFDAGTFDCVVCTFTLCSVGSPSAALSEARRVLKPGGRYLFCEHGLAPDPEVAKWQRRIEPFWRPIAGGCHLTRPIVPPIEAAGFEVSERDSMYLPGAPRIAGWNEWGVAVAA
ncbi:MAG: class I SAM-dependent methyltransferase [Caulobacterales bacterium]